MTAIVYTTNTGSSKRYAEMLSEKTGFPCFAFSDSDKIAEGSEIIYISWVMAGALQGINEARQKFGSLKAVCAVGMMTGEKAEADITAKNAITEPLFTLPGAFDLGKLKGMYKMMMGMMIKMMKGKLKDSTDPTEKKVLDMFEKGFDNVDEKHLSSVLKFLGFETEESVMSE